MKISDVLRAMADLADSDGPEGTAFKGRLEPVELQGTTVASVTTSTAGKLPSGNDRDPEELFLPPLQQKQELLKKAVGVENVYDDGTPEQRELEREAAEGPWTGPTKEYDYVGAPATQSEAPQAEGREGEDSAEARAVQSEEPEEDEEKIANESQDEIQRMRKNAGMKVNPAVLSALSDDSPMEG